MHRPRPARLPGLSYVGGGRYHARTSTSCQHPAFENLEVVEAVRRLLVQSAEQQQFTILAYCFMPDHVHVLLQAQGECADLRGMIRRWKQASGFWYSKQYGRTLWQDGYFDRILRREEATEVVATYITSNPVRAGLARHVGEYPYAWMAGTPVEQNFSSVHH
jgi:REP-associated tyrosine transposase